MPPDIVIHYNDARSVKTTYVPCFNEGVAFCVGQSAIEFELKDDAQRIQIDVPGAKSRVLIGRGEVRIVPLVENA